MKACIGLCVATVLLYIVLCAPRSSMAQINLNMICDANSTIGNDLPKISQLLSESPSEQCRIQLIKLVMVQDFVANAPTVFTALAVICEPNCTDYVLNFALQCRPSYVNLLGLACGRNEANASCYQTVLVNNGTSVLHRCFPEQFNATFLSMQTTTDSNTTENTTTTSPEFVCHNECRAELEAFRMFHGCCISNAFNTTTFELMRFGLANYSLWGACGVQPIIGFCPLPFTVPATTESATTFAPTTLGTDVPTDSGFTVVAGTMLILMVALITLISH